MTLSIQTFAALTSALAIVASIVSFPAFGVTALLIIPMIVLGIALSSPQNGTQLDPSGSWTCKFLTKTWLFSIAFLIGSIITLALLPSLRARVSRIMTTGDMRAYHVPILLQVTDSESAKLEGKKIWIVGDSSGKRIGELRYVNRQETRNWQTGAVQTYTTGWLSTDSSTYNGTYEAKREFAVSIGEENNIILKPAQLSTTSQPVP